MHHKHISIFQERDQEAVLPGGCGILGTKEDQVSHAHGVDMQLCEGVFFPNA